MGFSSIPSYLDPSNWQQQPQNFQVGNTSINPQLPPPPPPPPQPHGGSIRPGSMAERARLANIPMPEGPLKCPRCDSVNTKFCYFNNYSLSQPRHFCKTCRRYWTRGGALRSVPVGGGCRRNKRSKGGGSSVKTSVPGGSGSAACAGASSSTTTGTGSGSGASSNEILGLGTAQLPPPLRFMAPLQYLNEFTNSGDIGSNYGGIITSSPLGDMNLHSSVGGCGSGDGGGSGMNPNYSLLERWRYEHTHHLTGMSGLDPQTGGYPFEGIVMGSSGLGPSGFSGGGSSSPARVTPPPPSSSSSTSGLITQLASVKMEDGNHHQELNLSSRMQLLGNDHHHHQLLWNNSSSSNNPTYAWTDLSGFGTSSTTITSSHL